MNEQFVLGEDVTALARSKHRSKLHPLYWWLRRVWANWNPREIFYHLLWFWQRGRRGWSDRDTWSFDCYLASILAGGLTHLRDTGHGYPPDLSPERWRAILTEMADGFAAYESEMENCQGMPPRLVRSLDLLREWFGALWD